MDKLQAELCGNIRYVQVIFLSILANIHISSELLRLILSHLCCEDTRSHSPGPSLNTPTGLISCRMISHPDCLLSLSLSFACITSSLTFCHSVTRSKHQLCSSVSDRTKTNSSTRSFSISFFLTHKGIPSLIPSPGCCQLRSCIFMYSPAADYHCLLHCQNSFSLCLTQRVMQTQLKHRHRHTHCLLHCQGQEKS